MRRTRRSGESGIALPVTIMILTIALLLTGFALLSAVRSSRQTTQDIGEKGALQAADAGLALAKTRSGLLKGSLLPSTPCVSLDQTTGQLAAVGPLVGSLTSVLGSLLTGQCAPITDTYANGATSTYTVITRDSGGGIITQLLGNLFSTLLNVKRTVVSVGTYKGVTRKVAQDITLGSTTATGTTLFGKYAIQSLAGLSFANNTQIYGGVRTNGGISLVGSSKVNCGGDNSGDATPGPGNAVTFDNSLGTTANKYVVCAGANTAPAQSAFTLPAYDASGAAASNDDSYITNCNWLLNLGNADYCPAYNVGYNWNASAKTLSFSYGTWYMNGGTYYLCRLEMQGGTKVIVSNKAKIVIDAAACPAGTSGAGQFIKNNNSALYPTSGTAADLQVYVVGGGSVNITSSSPQSVFTLYAPTSTVTLANGGTDIKGAVAAAAVIVTGGGSAVRTDSSVAGITTASGTSATAYQASNYRECVQVSTSGVTDGCDGPS